MDAFALRDRVLHGLHLREAELLDAVISNTSLEPTAIAERAARIRGLREAADILRAAMEQIT